MVSCATPSSHVRQADFDAWKGVSRVELETHPLFSRMPRKTSSLPDGTEAWDFGGCSDSGDCCFHRFYLRGEVVQKHRPLGRCRTDCSTVPARMLASCEGREPDGKTESTALSVLRAIAAGMNAGAAVIAQDGSPPSPATRTPYQTSDTAPSPMPQPGSPPQVAQPFRSTEASAGCSSDFDCGIGHRCVKPYYSGTGKCLETVNQHGLRTFDLPRTDSVGPNMPTKSSCKFLTDCPVGFRCDMQSGTCVK